jgi:hypothetical protein
LKKWKGSTSSGLKPLPESKTSGSQPEAQTKSKMLQVKMELIDKADLQVKGLCFRYQPWSKGHKCKSTNGVETKMDFHKH